MSSSNGLPSGWREATIGSICDIRRGASPRPIDDPQWFADQGPGWVRIVDVTRSRRYLRHTEQTLSELGASKSVRVKPGDVIMSICATIGCPVVVDMDACIHDGFVLFDNLSGEVDPEYLCHLLERESVRFSNQGQKGTQGNLNTSIVKAALLLLPPRKEQHRITLILAAVDDAIDKTRAVIDQTQKFKAALLENLWAKGLPGTHGKSRIVKLLGRVPSDWDVTELDAVARISNGSTPSRSERNYWNGNIPWLPTGKVNDINIYDADEFITELALRDCPVRVLKPGTTLIAMIGQGKTRGRAAYLGVEATINQNFAAIEPNPTLHARFLFHYLASQYSRLRAAGRGTNQDALNCEILKAFRIPLPPTDEQIIIATLIDAIDERMQVDRLTLNRLNSAKNALGHALLTGGVRIPKTEDE